MPKENVSDFKYILLLNLTFVTFRVRWTKVYLTLMLKVIGDSIMPTDIDIFWKNKVKKVAEISKENNFPEQTEEFWYTQSAGVISLIITLDQRIDTYIRDIGDWR